MNKLESKLDLEGNKLIVKKKKKLIMSSYMNKSILSQFKQQKPGAEGHCIPNQWDLPDLPRTDEITSKVNMQMYLECHVLHSLKVIIN